MIPTLGNFILVLQLYFFHEFSLQRAFYILTVLVATYPLFRLHLNQRREPRQPQETAWLRSIVAILARTFNSGHEHPYFLPEADDLGTHLSQRVCQDLEQLYHILGIDDASTQLFPKPHTILCTARLHCMLCPNDVHPPTLRRHRKSQQVRLIDSRFRWVKAELFVAYCSKCDAEYYPDRRLEYNAAYLCVSKHGSWMDRRAALAQENAILRFHSGCDTMDASPRITTRQSQRLYFEHFTRRLITSHGLEDTFTVPAHSSAHVLAESVWCHGAMDHGSTNCTHLKRYTADLLAEGAVLDENENGVVDASGPTHPNAVPIVPGSGRGYARLAVMDGKTITHRICAISICEQPLVKYKNGCFCKDHLEMGSVCRIIPCGQPVHSDGAFLNQFSQLSFPGVQHVIHWGQCGSYFRARSMYCLQTVQWSCGCPIGWGKCYCSESSSQVLKIIDKIWESHPNSRPSFLAYEDACNLLHHIITQNPNSSWIKSTKFIVDAWHYIGHHATDLLCRIWCNPAPTNGSQPDLISVSVDNNGRTHTTRAFNTDTAEKLNAWLNGYEAQLRQMSDINYDFSVHVLMLIYKELVDKRVAKKEQSLTEEFWEMVDSMD
ncbi:hypothetical protein B0H10DRAFT_2280214 [Mycena sp. CBHHK59/15]|nr:hypothetical protein B0H10DRAFT_2280214 [Mycena sp. CBHHK59/15]